MAKQKVKFFTTTREWRHLHIMGDTLTIPQIKHSAHVGKSLLKNSLESLTIMDELLSKSNQIWQAMDKIC